MRRRSHFLAHSAIIAALYAVLCHFQNLLLPGSATWAIQLRAAEALCILAFFTPAAIPGLGIGCLLFNVSFAGALPLDFLVGTLASGLAAEKMATLPKQMTRWAPYPLASTRSRRCAARPMPATCSGMTAST